MKQGQIYRQQKYPVKDIEQFKPIRSQVLLKVHKPTNKTNGGLIVPTIEGEAYDLSGHSERVFEVVSVPGKLSMKSSAMWWETDVELNKGDIVIVDYLSSLNTWRYTDEGGNGDYRFFTYSDVYCKILDDKSLEPLNGYVICEKTHTEDRILSYSKKRVNETEGIVRFVGSPNKKYLKSGRTDNGIDVNPGDKIEILPLQSNSAQINLESDLHSVLDREYFMIQRWRIAGIIQ